ncbi:MAG: 50S ribosomal protein L19 [Candidatus Omnitrophica bacterium]|nr:50S ribosomal protein L19 [Candidatus Omnitrophota bacterium]
MDKIKRMESSQMKKDLPSFNIGDTVKVYSKIVEEGKTRLQAFEGTVIKKKGSGIKESFTVRRISYGEGVEKTFPIHSPMTDSIKVTRKGKVRRAKLYYLRKKIGKKSKIEGMDIFGGTNVVKDEGFESDIQSKAETDVENT